MVAALAEPKDRVFTNIWEYVDENTPVIYRTYTGMRAILYSPVLDKDTRGFHKEVMLLPTGNTNNTSVLIRKWFDFSIYVYALHMTFFTFFR